MDLKQKALFVNLSTGTIEKKPISQAMRRKFLGGRGIDAYILYKYIKPGIDAFSPGNVLSVSAGILVGTGMPSCGRTHVSGKSPLTGGFGSSNMGGEWSPELRYAGYDHVVALGKAEHPVYILIQDDKVEIKDGRFIWGKTTHETEKLIRAANEDEDIKVLSCGPAGENLVRFANVITAPKNCAGRSGMGGVMGSKNLKAIAVRGTKGLPPVDDVEKVLNLREELNNRLLSSKAISANRNYGTMFVYSTSNWAGQIRVKNFQLNQMANGQDLEPESFMEKYAQRPMGCFGCSHHCRHVYAVPYGDDKGYITEGPEYTYLGGFGTEVGNPRLDVVLAAGLKANLLGIDCLEYGSMLSWAMELYEKGLITDEITGGPLEWGDPDVILGMLDKVAYRKGFGDVLADGPLRAIARLGEETRYYNINVKGLSGLHSDERSVPGFALGVGVSTRGMDHLRSRPALNLLNLPKKAYEDLYEFEVVNDYEDYGSKGKIIGWHEECFAIADATGICKTNYVLFTPHLFAFKDSARMVTETIGIDFTYQQMHDVGRRIYTVERLFNNREGMRRKDDYLPERMYTEPTPLGPPKNRGKMINRQGYDQMLDEYYEYKGWSDDGIPSEETLNKIGLGDLETMTELM